MLACTVCITVLLVSYPGPLCVGVRVCWLSAADIIASMRSIQNPAWVCFHLNSTKGLSCIIGLFYVPFAANLKVLMKFAKGYILSHHGEGCPVGGPRGFVWQTSCFMLKI